MRLLRPEDRSVARTVTPDRGSSAEKIRADSSATRQSGVRSSARRDVMAMHDGGGQKMARDGAKGSTEGKASRGRRSRRGRRVRAKQLELAYETRPQHGGKRPGAGRKRSTPERRVPHVTRDAFRDGVPAHVAMKVREGLPSLRSRQLYRVVEGAIFDATERLGTRICEFSVQSNHLHVIIEARDKVSLTRAMQGLAIRIAKRVNRALDRKGKFFRDRFFSRLLRTPLEVKRALRYVLQNALHHGAIRSGIDPCSSARWFEGWSRNLDSAPIREETRDGPSLFAALAQATAPPPHENRTAASPLARARGWLPRKGWRIHGLLELDVEPAHA
jgi:REP element-mobilizing transposase RayT